MAFLTLQDKASKLIDKAGDDMNYRQARRYFDQVVLTRDELAYKGLEPKTQIALARIAGSLQAEFGF